MYIFWVKINLAFDTFCIVYIALHEYSACVLIKLDLFTYPTLYK